MKNQAKLNLLKNTFATEESIQEGYDEVTERYYYLKFGEILNGRPSGGVATICLLQVGEVTHRGIAFCSPLDQFARKVGRNIALGRAIRAMECECSSLPIPLNTPARVLATTGWAHVLTHLSAFNAGLTEYEQKIMEVKK